MCKKNICHLFLSKVVYIHSGAVRLMKVLKKEREKVE